MNEEKLIEAMDSFIITWRKKGFHEEALMPLGVLAGSKEGIKRFGNETTAFNALASLVKNNNDEQFIIDEFYKMICEVETQ